MNRDSAVGRPGGGRHRPPPQLVEVVAVARVAPRLVAVRVQGDDLTRFAHAAPTSHIKVFLPAPGQDEPTLPTVTPEGRFWPEGAVRPTVRTYTPRSFDPATGTLEVQFVLHGAGPASEWAQRVRIGDRIAIGGPGGRFSPDLGVRRWWLAGDESALPAIGTLLDVLPATAVAEVHVEVADAQDEFPLPTAAAATVTWHHRSAPDVWGEELYDATVAASLSDDTQVWVACEASTVRRIRRLLVERKVSALVTRGYWRRGEADHPDHDYGED